ncbi:MAG: hypothetical protein ACP5GT_03800 [Conexivisphaera sp.]
MRALLLAMTLPMIAEHAAVAALSIRGRAPGRSAGLPLAACEVLYYALAVALLSPPTALAIPLYAFAATHFAGAAGYALASSRPGGLRGLLGSAAGTRALTYYAAYELALLASIAALLLGALP